MNRCKWWLCGMAVLFLVVSPALAQKAEGPGAGKTKQAAKEGGKKGEKPKSGLPGDLAIMVKELNLTADQKAKLQEIAASYAAKLKENSDKRKPLLDAQKEARKAEDKEKLTSLGKELKELNTDRRKIEAERTAAVMGVLTPEQKGQWQLFQLCREVMGRYKAAELTEEQKTKIKELCKPAANELSGLGRKDPKRRSILEDLHKKIASEILTEQQKQTLTASELFGRVMRRYRRARLTKEQQGKIKELCPAAGKDWAAAKDRDERRKVENDLDQKIRAEVLTEEQREKMKPRPPQGKAGGGEGKPKEKAGE